MSNPETKVHHDPAQYPLLPNQPPSYQGPPQYQTVQPVPQMVPGSVTVVSSGGGTAVVTGGATMIVATNVGSKPTAMTCPHCQAQITTRVERKATLRTHLFAALLCVLFCWPCVCVPYCVDSCRSAEHYCPNCNAFIGVHKN